VLVVLVVLVAKQVRRSPSASVKRNWAPGCGRSLPTISRIPLAGAQATQLRPNGSGMLADLGTAAITDTCKPRGQDLTDVQRACGDVLDRLRAAVEHERRAPGQPEDPRHWPTRMPDRLSAGTAHRHQQC